MTCLHSQASRRSLPLFPRCIRRIPPPPPPPPLAQVACSYSHTVVVTDDDRTWTFGGNDYGQLGHGDQSSRSAPAALACFQGLGVLSVACGVYHTVCR